MTITWNSVFGPNWHTYNRPSLGITLGNKSKRKVNRTCTVVTKLSMACSISRHHCLSIKVWSSRDRVDFPQGWKDPPHFWTIIIKLNKAMSYTTKKALLRHWESLTHWCPNWITREVSPRKMIAVTKRIPTSSKNDSGPL